ncbi:MAG: gamma-glutamylcyclotransferase, partial [Sulfurospirillum sp.]|nr:gamma-glutamylcyclotransferase [Sulfurospirillum sp.]
MAHIFTYGSLMFEEVWNSLVLGQYTSAPAFLEGYARRCVKNEEYPVVFEANESVNGILYYDVEPYDVERLDAFEGEYY